MSFKSLPSTESKDSKTKCHMTPRRQISSIFIFSFGSYIRPRLCFLFFFSPNFSPIDTSWTTNGVLDYACKCFVPKFSGVVQSWYSNMTEEEWTKNATERIVMHGKVTVIDMFFVI